MEKEREAMREIEKRVVEVCQDAFRFAGVMRSENEIIINSGEGNSELIIKIELKNK